MNIRANTENNFLLKYLAIGALCLAFAAWSLYDGLINYPGKIPRSKAWKEIKEKYPEPEWGPKWRELSAEKGWNPKRPKKDESVEAIESKIIWQWVFLAIGLGVGAPCILWYLKNKGTWVELSGEEITSSWGKGFKLDDVTKFDKRKWDKKGIGVVHFENEEGLSTFVLDDLKFERDRMDEIVVAVEKFIGREKIVNGEPEISAGSTVEKKEAGEDEMS